MLKKWKRAENNGKVFGILLTILTGKGYDVKVGAGPWDPGTRDPGSSSKFKSGTPGPPIKFKSGTFIITFLHCYIYNMEIIFHE